MEEKGAISGYKLSKNANNFCIAVFFSCAVVYGLALLGIDYPPLTKTFGWLAFSVAVAINSPKLRIRVREEQNWEHGKTTGRAMSGKSEK
ncbi:hypothetical protein [Vibrio parahaemolyticus]|uniref:hypothetical protein n=1 Tax=Vibrio parahaemolyticus TaxID=670 RepID=UPI0004214100|nr:hypothetical protein [Vibrio parahaemolyticus]HCE4957886.1 hypothetical protein [Vibrio parahaemolyticus]